MADTLIEALDAGATKLLEMAMAPAKNDDGTPTLVTLAERVKAFEAVVEWAKTRDPLVPKEIKESKFDGIRREFNGKTIDGRRDPRGRKKRIEVESPADGAPDGANGISAAALFDA